MSERILALGRRYGYEESPRRGFWGMASSDGKRLDIFSWSNAAEAERRGVPRKSLCCVVDDGVRVHVPLVEWPSSTQSLLPWAEVEALFDQIVGPLLDPNRDEES